MAHDEDNRNHSEYLPDVRTNSGGPGRRRNLPDEPQLNGQSHEFVTAVEQAFGAGGQDARPTKSWVTPDTEGIFPISRTYAYQPYPLCTETALSGRLAR